MALLPTIDLLPAMEAAFVAASQGRAQIAPVGELVFADPRGDVHIKAGHVDGDPCYVVKVASGFYANPSLGLPSSSGLMLLFDRQTGEPRAILLDGGMLTDERTAAAGAVAAKWLASPDPDYIGVLGAGIQAERQLAHLRAVTSCRKVALWARRAVALDAFAARAEALGFLPELARSPAEVADKARLIVTTTPSDRPLLHAADVRLGTHITAVGADSLHKGELAADLIAFADVRVADHLAQSRERGEFRRAAVDAPIVELGAIIAGGVTGRTSVTAITIADLTGVAVQDSAIAHAIHAASRLRGESR